MDQNWIPVAQYLRVSTEHQQYSQENQAAVIEVYARKHGMYIAKTYSDVGRSGVVLKRRAGLSQLLRDVVNGDLSYSHILVYDVSRWGRFQDTDESAHYEFMCKSAGIPVHYCAETFTNDGSLPNVVVKALKRLMAGEYSRELSLKVSDGMNRLARLGFRTGGVPGYGLRRLLVSPDRSPKHELGRGQRKSIAEDRIILIPGPQNELATVREIFRLFVDEDEFPAGIAKRLNQAGISYPGATRKSWYPQAVDRILKNPKYAGWHVYGKFSEKLDTKRIAVPSSAWIQNRHAWTPVVPEELYLEAQRKFAEQTYYKPNKQILEQLDSLLREKGLLSERLVYESAGLPSNAAFRRRFGSLTEAFAQAGYTTPRLHSLLSRRDSRTFRDRLLDQIIATSGGKLQVIQYNGHWRPKLRAGNGSLISIYICRCLPTRSGPRWILQPVPREHRYLSLVARLDADNRQLLDLHLLPSLPRRTRYTLKMKDSLLEKGERIIGLSNLVHVADSVRRRATTNPPSSPTRPEL